MPANNNGTGTAIIFFSILLISILLGGCITAERTCAPVVNAWQDPDAIKSRYRVQKDDTIYSIALGFDIDYRDLAKANHLAPPYHLKPGQTLTMCLAQSGASDSSVEVFPVKDCCLLELPSQTVHQNIAQEELILPQVDLSCRSRCTDDFSKNPCLPTPPDKNFEKEQMAMPAKTGCWCWPACGKVVKEFALQPGGNKGIDIAGQLGEPVRAIAPGKVVYCGNGLRGYGNLIIIKHSDNYLSAYAYNKKLLVKEGDVVRLGTEIAKMGQNESGDVLLHFEIRRNGKPVNPLLYL
jgi:lipoprotein NlpD